MALSRHCSKYGESWASGVMYQQQMITTELSMHATVWSSMHGEISSLIGAQTTAWTCSNGNLGYPFRAL
eukprot:jgi/Botrbrau1/22025/Bobra.0024s0039.1